MIELKILVDNIDYDSLADVLVPLIAEKLREGEKGGILGGVLAKNPDTATSMARTILSKMSQEKKNELLLQMLTKHREKLLQAGRGLLSKKGIGMELCDISARKI